MVRVDLRPDPLNREAGDHHLLLPGSRRRPQHVPAAAAIPGLGAAAVVEQRLAQSDALALGLPRSGVLSAGGRTPGGTPLGADRLASDARGVLVDAAVAYHDAVHPAGPLRADQQSLDV